MPVMYGDITGYHIHSFLKHSLAMVHGNDSVELTLESLLNSVAGW